jgi:hypothetical protein
VGGGDLVVANGIFQRNLAAEGSALMAFSERSVKVSNTSFDDPAHAFAGKAVDVQVRALEHSLQFTVWKSRYMTMFTVLQDCMGNPCDYGESCSFRTYSTFCDRCASNEIGPDGVACTACPGGTEPDVAQTACVPCPPGKESKIGLCTTCPAGKIGVNGTCSSCPGANQEPMDGATICRCQTGFYDSSYGMVQCPDDDEAAQHGLVCQPCGDCLDCTIGDGENLVRVRPGFALGPTAAAMYQGIQAGALHIKKVLHRCVQHLHLKDLIHRNTPDTVDFPRCSRDMCIGESTVPGIQCRAGHDPSSPLCHVCTEGFVEGMDQMCFECDADDASLSSEVRTILLCVAIIVVILLGFAAHRLYRAHVERGEIKDAGEMRWVKPSFTAGGSAPLKIYAKICISHYQILTQFRESLGSAKVWL